MSYSKRVERQGATVVFAPVGWVDGEVVEAFTADLLDAARAAKDAGDLLVDLAGLEFMVSRGLRALTMAQREGAAIRLANPNARMAEILAISRYDKLFPVVGHP